jgi:hypothetical protein
VNDELEAFCAEHGIHAREAATGAMYLQQLHRNGRPDGVPQLHTLLEVRRFKNAALAGVFGISAEQRPALLAKADKIRDAHAMWKKAFAGKA